MGYSMSRTFGIAQLVVNICFVREHFSCGYGYEYAQVAVRVRCRAGGISAASDQLDLP